MQQTYRKDFKYKVLQKFRQKNSKNNADGYIILQLGNEFSDASMDCKDEASPDEIAFLAGRGQLVNAVGAIVNGKFVLRGKNCRIEEIVTDNIHQCKYGNSISNANSEVDVLNEAAFLIESGYKHENIKGYQRIMNSACAMFKSDIQAIRVSAFKNQYGSYSVKFDYIIKRVGKEDYKNTDTIMWGYEEDEYIDLLDNTIFPNITVCHNKYLEMLNSK